MKEGKEEEKGKGGEGRREGGKEKRGRGGEKR